ncbi:MAG: HAD family phosphatase, partial [Calditrichota bacterium]
ERPGRTAWQKAVVEWGYEMSDATYSLVSGRTVPDAERIFAEVYGTDFPFYAIRKRRVEIAQEHFAKHGVQVMEGAEELLDLIISHDFPRAVATSTAHKAAYEKLEKTGLKSYFPTIVTGDEVEKGKPAPDIFLLAAKRINANPAECVVLEDSEAGIRAASKAGMTPIMVPDLITPSKEIKNIAAHIMPSLHAVRGLFEKTFLR